MKLSDVRVIGVLGAGQMGRGIAQVCAAARYAVRLDETGQAAREQAPQQIRAALQRGVEHGATRADEIEPILARIDCTADLKALAAAQLVIEAVPEDVRLKEDLFARLGALCPPDTILASNTSSISISGL